MGEVQTYASNSGDINFLFILIIVGTYLLYEVGKAILDNNDDDDMDGGMMMRVADGAQAWIKLYNLNTTIIWTPRIYVSSCFVYQKHF